MTLSNNMCDRCGVKLIDGEWHLVDPYPDVSCRACLGPYEAAMAKGVLPLADDEPLADWEKDLMLIPDHMTGLKPLLAEIEELMYERGRKYGPGNIAEFGELGVLVRMSDKFARLRNGLESHSDETVTDTLLDVIGYSLIWIMLRRGQWPTKESAPLPAFPPF